MKFIATNRKYFYKLTKAIAVLKFCSPHSFIDLTGNVATQHWLVILSYFKFYFYFGYKIIHTFRSTCKHFIVTKLYRIFQWPCCFFILSVGCRFVDTLPSKFATHYKVIKYQNKYLEWILWLWQISHRFKTLQY